MKMINRVKLFEGFVSTMMQSEERVQGKLAKIDEAMMDAGSDILEKKVGEIDDSGSSYHLGSGIPEKKVGDIDDSRSNYQ
ncbi:hypothetical protein RYX36_023115 [Vicia faba]